MAGGEHRNPARWRVEFIGSTSGQSLSLFENGNSSGSQLVENAEVKKLLRKAKVFLDNTYWCDTLSLVEKWVPVKTGTFCFLGYNHPLR
jgi:hypothetical protein